ncbi:MAG: class D sortase [Holophagales bacterium]|nr:class D sortase [Holophagales bacterium]
MRRGEAVLVVVGLALLGEVLIGAANARVQGARDERTLLEAERMLPTRLSRSAPSRPASTPTVAPSGPAVLARIEIPRVGVSAIVRDGDDDATLAVAVGHVRGTARPGEPGNVVLAGHRDSFFRGLRKIRLDDRIWIRAPGHHVEYRVDSTEVVGPGETRVLAGTADDRLTLVTCYPFGFIGSAPKRFIVTASRILRPKAGPPPFTVSGNLEVGDDR